MHNTLPEWSDTIATFAEAPADGDADAHRWADLCRRRIMALDRGITADLAGAIATYMSTRAAWRQQPPERAVEQIYGLPHLG